MSDEKIKAIIADIQKQCAELAYQKTKYQNIPDIRNGLYEQQVGLLNAIHICQKHL